MTDDQTSRQADGLDERLIRFIAQQAIPLLLAFGLVLIVLGVWVDDDSATSTALVVMGAGAVILGLLRYHLRDDFEIGPRGMKGTLRDPEALQRVIRRGIDEAVPPGADVVIKATPATAHAGG